MREGFSNFSPPLGVHVSIAGGHDRGLREAAGLGCEVAQVFTKNNMRWFAPPLSDEAVARYGRAREESGLLDVFGHAGYLINLAAADPAKLENSRLSLLRELELSSQLGLSFLVLHPGAHLGAGEEAGLRLAAESLDWVLERYGGETRIALEVTAGQGTCLGGRLEHLAFLLEGCSRGSGLGVCLDTCHLFAAGYDLRGEEGIGSLVREFSGLMDWGRVVCLHVNDSKGGLGSRLDRHELLGEGKLGWGCFRVLMGHPAFQGIPFCLETPKGKDNINDRRTLEKLKEIRAEEAG